MSDNGSILLIGLAASLLFLFHIESYIYVISYNYHPFLVTSDSSVNVTQVGWVISVIDHSVMQASNVCTAHVQMTLRSVNAMKTSLAQKQAVTGKMISLSAKFFLCILLFSS